MNANPIPNTPLSIMKSTMRLKNNDNSLRADSETTALLLFDVVFDVIPQFIRSFKLTSRTITTIPLLCFNLGLCLDFVTV